MIDLRPVTYVIGLLVTFLGAAMVFPLVMDLWRNDGDWPAFAQSGVVTLLFGGAMAIASSNGLGDRLTLQQTFLLTTGVWVVLPIFGALPFAFGAPGLSVTDAFFEAMSGLTTTGSTVMTNIDGLSAGMNLWRAMLQWFGGIGIIVVAMVFLPELRVGGMQIFRSEGFETLGKILPRAGEIASRISWIYILLTAVCTLAYLACGLSKFDAVVHAMTTLSTGGFSSRDASFGAFSVQSEYVAIVFMSLAALPFVRYVQLLAGSARPLWVDPQIRGFFVVIGGIGLGLTVWLWVLGGEFSEVAFREALFNTVSIVTGTGYASADYGEWGGFAMAVLFLAGLVGGCAGSTACSVKIFRYQLLIASIKAQIRSIYQPSGIFIPRYAGRRVDKDVMNSVLSFFVLFFTSLGVFSILLSLTGLDMVTSVSGAATALANIGPGLGEQIGPAGNFAGLPDTAKWILCGAMIIGRLELMAVFALFTLTFWRA